MRELRHANEILKVASASPTPPLGSSHRRRRSLSCAVGPSFVGLQIQYSLVERTADAGIDAARGGAAGPAFEAVRDGGRFCTIVPDAPLKPARGIDPVMILVQSNGAQMRELARQASEGVVSGRVSRVLPLEEAAAAHDLVMAGGLGGKLVLRVS